jgi:hypothetical protein
MNLRLSAAKAAATATVIGLGLAGAALASPVAASTALAHCNVMMVGGYSPCSLQPIQAVSPGGPMRPLPR